MKQMDFYISFNNSSGIFTVTTSGKMGGECFIEMAQDLLRHQRWRPGKNVIFDHSDLDFSKVPVTDIDMIRSFHRENEERIGSGKSAIVVKPGLLQNWYTLWNCGQKIQTGSRSMVFENFDDAIHWIDKEG